MTNTTKIAFQLSTTDASARLGFEAWIDDHKFFETEHVELSQEIFVEIPDNDAEHELRFILKNKTSEHTKIDKDGNIIKDARLSISNLSFDEIQLGLLFSNESVYMHSFNDTVPETQNKFYGEMGCNGIVGLKFSTPVYLWLLEHM